MVYFQENWLVGNFVPRIWNVFSLSSLRTNNHLEGREQHVEANQKEYIYIFSQDQISLQEYVRGISARTAI